MEKTFTNSANSLALRPYLDTSAHPTLCMGGQEDTGESTLAQLAGKDLNRDGKLIFLVICGNSRFYNYSFVEEEIELWVKYNGYPDVVILGGASGVDYLAERWADNNNIPIAVFKEAWAAPRPNSPQDSGRPEAVADLGERMMKHATHVLAFPGPRSKWTKHMESIAKDANIPVVSVLLPME
mgnify:FL=1